MPPVNPGVSIQPPPRSSTDPVHSSTHIQLPKSVLRVESNLPQPAEATQLRNEHVALRTLFSNHVQCFYHGDDVRKTLDAATSMKGLFHVGLDDQEARQMLQSAVDPSTRHHAIRRLLGYAILRRIQPDILNEVSLLPTGTVRTLEAMSAYKGSQQGRCKWYEIDSAVTKNRNIDKNILLSKWRVLTGTLTYERHVANAFNADDERLQIIYDLVRSLDIVLAPFAVAELNDQRVSHLTELIKRATLYGNLLLSQGAAWSFQWIKGRNAGTRAAFPALVQLTDSNGIELPEMYILAGADA